MPLPKKYNHDEIVKLIQDHLKQGGALSLFKLVRTEFGQPFFGFTRIKTPIWGGSQRADDVGCFQRMPDIASVNNVFKGF